MSKKPSAAALGAFIVGAVAITALTIILFGKASFLAKQPRFVVFFPGSVQGLSPGAPVVFRGATIGTVLDLQVHYNATNNQVDIPVTIELDRGLVHGLDLPDTESTSRQKRVLDSGMRAQLIRQSFVTGQKAVALDFLPDTKAELTQSEILTSYPEIPSLANPLDEFSQKIEALPLDDIAKLLQESLSGISKIVNSPEAQELAQSLSKGVKEGEKLIVELRPIAQNFDELLKDIRERVKNSKSNEIAENLDLALENLNGFLTNANQLVGSGTPVDRSLREIADAARELRILIEYLQRHPEALVKGKPGDS